MGDNNRLFELGGAFISGYVASRAINGGIDYLKNRQKQNQPLQQPPQNTQRFTGDVAKFMNNDYSNNHPNGPQFGN